MSDSIIVLTERQPEIIEVVTFGPQGVRGLGAEDVARNTDELPEGTSNLYLTATRVRNTVLTGISTATNAVVGVTDTVLTAIGKLQKQVSDFVGSIGQAGGIAPLGSDGKVPSANLPTPAAPVASVAGANKQVQINDGGALGADSGLTFDKATGSLNSRGDLSSRSLFAYSQYIDSANWARFAFGYNRSGDFQICSEKSGSAAALDMAINSAGHLFLSATAGGSVFAASSNGGWMLVDNQFYGDGGAHMLPRANGTQDFGTSSQRIRAVYANKLDLSGAANTANSIVFGPHTYDPALSCNNGVLELLNATQASYGSLRLGNIYMSGTMAFGYPGSVAFVLDRGNTGAQIWNATETAFADLQCRMMQPVTFTVGTLPSANTLGNGARAHVSDATAPTFGATVVGGGSVSIPVFSDGTNWKVG